MGDIYDKLYQLKFTKQQIMNAIIAKGVDVPKDATFYSAGAYIREITARDDLTFKTEEITPNGYDLDLVPADYSCDAFSEVIVKGDDNLYPDNIKKDATIYGVTGTYEPPLEETTITPTEEDQVITPDEGYDGFSQVTVLGVTPGTGTGSGEGGGSIDTSSLDTLSDVVVDGKDRTYIAEPGGTEGSSADSELSGEDDAPTTITVDSAGFNRVNIPGDTNLIPSNIKSGVTIYGVTGTCTSLVTDNLTPITQISSHSSLYNSYGDTEYRLTSYSGNGVSPINGYVTIFMTIGNVVSSEVVSRLSGKGFEVTQPTPTIRNTLNGAWTSVFIAKKAVTAGENVAHAGGSGNGDFLYLTPNLGAYLVYTTSPTRVAIVKTQKKIMTNVVGHYTFSNSDLQVPQEGGPAYIYVGYSAIDKEACHNLSTLDEGYNHWHLSGLESWCHFNFGGYSPSTGNCFAGMISSYGNDIPNIWYQCNKFYGLNEAPCALTTFALYTDSTPAETGT